MSDLVSIITVNYFSEDEILECLDSISEKNTAHVEVIIISNSPFQQEAKAKLNNFEFPVLIHQNEDNMGFAKACNKGAVLASGEYLFFLNPDTRFMNDAVKELKQCYQSWNNPGVIGPKTYDETGKAVPSAKNHLSKTYFWSMMFPFLDLIIPSSGRIGHLLPEQTQAVPVINGHALFIRQQLFEKLGGMEEEFFMYWEENDLCLRLKHLNREVIYCAEAKIMHKSGTSTRPYFIKMEIAKHRSQKQFILKHHPSLNTLNRISGCMGYSWRTLGSLLTLNRTKTAQFWNILVWYFFRYK